MKLLEFTLTSERKRGIKESEIFRKVRVLIPSQGAAITPPLGPTLGQFGVNIKDFCDKFNDRSKIFDNDIVLTVIIVLNRNKTFDFDIKLPSIPFMINEEEVDLENEYNCKYLTLSSIFKIMFFKEGQFSKFNKSLFFSIVGTARSMKVQIVNDTFNFE